MAIFESFPFNLIHWIPPVMCIVMHSPLLKIGTSALCLRAFQINLWNVGLDLVPTDLLWWYLERGERSDIWIWLWLDKLLTQFCLFKIDSKCATGSDSWIVGLGRYFFTITKTMNMPVNSIWCGATLLHHQKATRGLYYIIMSFLK